MKYKHPVLNVLINDEIKFLADKDYLEKAWVGGKELNSDDYAEAYNNFIGAWPFKIEDNYKNYGITEEQYRSLLRLKEAMNDYETPDFDDPKYANLDFEEGILKDPNWDKVIAIAQKTYCLLKDGPKAYDHGPYKSRELNAIVREDLKYIADRSYQDHVWIKEEGGVHDCLQDTIDLFLSRWPKNIDEKYKEFGLTDLQYKKLKILYEKIQTYVKPKKDEDALKDQKWLEIIDYAGRLYHEFNKDSKAS